MLINNRSGLNFNDRVKGLFIAEKEIIIFFPHRLIVGLL